MITKKILLELYGIENTGSYVFKSIGKQPAKKYVKKEIMSVWLKHDNSTNSQKKIDVPAIVEKLTPEDLKQIENDFIVIMFSTENIYFFKSFYVNMFNPTSTDIKKFLSSYFDDELYKIRNNLYSYEKTSAFFSSLVDDANVLNEKDKDYFINYCIKKILSLITSNFLLYGLLNFKLGLYFDGLSSLMKCKYAEESNLIEKEKEILKPLILSKLHAGDINKKTILKQLIPIGEVYFGEMKDVVFSILFEEPNFRKEYIKAQLQ